MTSEEQSSDFLIGARVWRPNMDATDYHRFSVQYKTALTRIWKGKIPDADKQLIERFARDCKADGVGFARLIKLVRNLAVIGDMLGKPFKDATIEDMKRIVHHFEVSVFCLDETRRKSDSQTILQMA